MPGSKVASLSSSSSSSSSSSQEAFLRRGLSSLYRLPHGSYRPARGGVPSSLESLQLLQQESSAEPPHAAALRNRPHKQLFPPSSSYLALTTPFFLSSDASRNFNANGSLTRCGLLCILDEALQVASEADYDEDWDHHDNHEEAMDTTRSPMNGATATTVNTASPPQQSPEDEAQEEITESSGGQDSSKATTPPPPLSSPRVSSHRPHHPNGKNSSHTKSRCGN
ncbi:hypothetical protein ACA910_004760 [Epithemia clementina (nom. ined.)]